MRWGTLAINTGLFNMQPANMKGLKVHLEIDGSKRLESLDQSARAALEGKITQRAGAMPNMAKKVWKVVP